MVSVLKTEYWSRADAFLYPLTGLRRSEDYEMESYLFWNDYSIEDYRLIVTFRYNNYDKFLQWCKDGIFPSLDKRGYLVETYDIGDRSIFILDMSEWALDIDLFIQGKYSKFSKEAKEMIEKYHTFNKNKIPIHIYAVLYPTMKMKLLDNLSPIEYVAENYGISLIELEKLAEIGSLYDEMSETLLTDLDAFTQNVT